MHLPKTAGTAFRRALDSVYGADLAAVYGGVGVDGRAHRAVHGHFAPARFWSAGRNARLIMWMRDPVERLVSHFDFWSGIPEGADNANHAHFIRSGMSLEEFATWDVISSEFEHLYLDGVDGPSDFDFIGFTDRFDADLARLAELLGWPTAPRAESANITPGERTVVTDRIRALIETHHAVEIDFYRRARELR